MSEYARQRAAKPAIDELIEVHLSGGAKERLIAFVAFLRENRMTPQWGAKNSYNVSHKNRRVAIIKLSAGSFQIWSNAQYDDAFEAAFACADEEIRDFLRSSIPFCYGCGTCRPGLDRRILGAQYAGVCRNPVIRMVDPDDRKLSLAMRLALLRKQAIAEGRAPKVTYIAKSRRAD